MHVKHAQPEHPILPLLAERWSPYVFDPRPVPRELLLTCLEAARWSASSYNEQPWIFFVAERTDEAAFSRMHGCLDEANQGWAKNASVLLLTAIRPTFSRNGKPNRVAEHDLGLAMGNLSIQATALGLHVHQMAGVVLDRVRATYQVPAEYNPMTAAAIGYAGDPAGDSQLGPRDTGERPRKKLTEFVFSGAFGQSFT